MGAPSYGCRSEQSDRRAIFNDRRAAAVRRGLFFAIEGIDGAGTTTQVKLLAERLRQQGFRVVATAEPSLGEWGQLVRRVLSGEIACNADTLALAFAADRLDHIQRTIEPALLEGRIVVSDRYVLSSLAYQSLESDEAWVGLINTRAPRADLNVIVELDSKTAEHRRRIRNQASERFDLDDIQRQAGQRYQALSQSEGYGPVVTIDGSPEPATVQRAIWAAIMPHLSTQQES